MIGAFRTIAKKASFGLRTSTLSRRYFASDKSYETVATSGLTTN
jgi:hypothetical protein